MRRKKYRREELDTFDDVYKEMQKLRDGTIEDDNKLAAIIGDVCRDMLARLAVIDERLKALEPKLSPKKKVSKPPKKKK